VKDWSRHSRDLIFVLVLTCGAEKISTLVITVKSIPWLLIHAGHGMTMGVKVIKMQTPKIDLIV